MNRWVWVLVAMLVAAGMSGLNRASDTLDGRAAVSGRVEQPLTKEQEQQQREMKAVKDKLKKTEEDRRKKTKEFDDATNEVDKIRRQIQQEKEQMEALLIDNQSFPTAVLKKWHKDRAMRKQTIRLGPFRIPNELP
jgi:septal ring factor EnvC (AmiA/AmiB activator)